MSYETIILTKNESIATVTLNRPDKLNATDDTMILEIAQVFNQLDGDEEVRAIILTGMGKGFCSGGDLTMSIYNTTDIAVLDRFMISVADMIKAVRNCSKPTIAAVNGVAVGGGGSTWPSPAI